MAKIYRPDTSGLSNKFIWPEALIEELNDVSAQDDFSGLEHDLVDLSIFLFQRKLVSLEELCSLYIDLINNIHVCNKGIYKAYLEISLWKGGADCHFADATVETTSCADFLETKQIVNPPKLLLVQEYLSNPDIMQLEQVFFKNDKAIVKEMVHIDVEPFFRPDSTDYRTYIEMFLQISKS